MQSFETIQNFWRRLFEQLKKKRKNEPRVILTEEQAHLTLNYTYLSFINFQASFSPSFSSLSARIFKFSLYIFENFILTSVDPPFSSTKMGRQPRRASGVKALQAIKETSQTNRTKVTAKVSNLLNYNSNLCAFVWF